MLKTILKQSIWCLPILAIGLMFSQANAFVDLTANNPNVTARDSEVFEGGNTAESTERDRAFAGQVITGADSIDVHSITFEPPQDRFFVPFEVTNNFVDVIHGGLFSGAGRPVLQGPLEISVMWMGTADPETVDQWQLIAEGNLDIPQGNGAPPPIEHWAVDVHAGEIDASGEIHFIRQTNNAPIPYPEEAESEEELNQACLRISKWYAHDNMGDSLQRGREIAYQAIQQNGDHDTFRLQIDELEIDGVDIQDLDANDITVSLNVMRNGTVISQDTIDNNGRSVGENAMTFSYNTQQNRNSQQRDSFRTDYYVRLVSRFADDMFDSQGQQTLRVDLGDIVHVEVLYQGRPTGITGELPVFRPASESGYNAIRYAHVHTSMITDRRRRYEPDVDGLIEFMDIDFAQTGISIEPVGEVEEYQLNWIHYAVFVGTTEEAGTVTLQARPIDIAQGNEFQFDVDVPAGAIAIEVAELVAQALMAHPEYNGEASAHENLIGLDISPTDDLYIISDEHSAVFVSYGYEILNLDNINGLYILNDKYELDDNGNVIVYDRTIPLGSSVTGHWYQQDALAALCQDNDPGTIEMILLSERQVSQGVAGISIPEHIEFELKRTDARNTFFLGNTYSRGLRATLLRERHSYVASHELGHVLIPMANHTSEPNNLMIAGGDADYAGNDTYRLDCRLTEEQHLSTRENSSALLSTSP